MSNLNTIYNNLWSNSWDDGVKTKLNALDLDLLQARAETDLFNPEIYDRAIEEAKAIRGQTLNEFTQRNIDEKIARWQVARRGLIKRIVSKDKGDLPSASDIENNFRAEIDFKKEDIKKAMMLNPMGYAEFLSKQFDSVDEETGKKTGIINDLDKELNNYLARGKKIPATLLKLKEEFKGQKEMYDKMLKGTDEIRDEFILAVRTNPKGDVEKWDLFSRYDIPDKWQGTHQLGDQKINGVNLMFQQNNTDPETGRGYAVLPGGSKAEYDSVSKRYETPKEFQLEDLFGTVKPSQGYYFNPNEIVKMDKKYYRYGEDNLLHLVSNESLIDKMGWRTQITEQPIRDYTIENEKEWAESEMIGNPITEKDYETSRMDQMNNELKKVKDRESVAYGVGELARESAKGLFTVPAKGAMELGKGIAKLPEARAFYETAIKPTYQEIIKPLGKMTGEFATEAFKTGKWAVPKVFEAGKKFVKGVLGQ